MKGDQTGTADQQVRMRDLEPLLRRTPRLVAVSDDTEVVRSLVPVPRRSRVFLRHGEVTARSPTSPSRRRRSGTRPTDHPPSGAVGRPDDGV